MNRREFVKLFAAAGIGFTFDYEYDRIETEPTEWEEMYDGLYFSQHDIFKGGELVDRVSAVKIDPEKNGIKVVTGYKSPGDYSLFTIDEWQQITGYPVCFNSAQYSADPYAMPCALVLDNGKPVGPKYNKRATGMFVSEPVVDSLPKADLLDFNFDSFDPENPRYLNGVQHWPILLDRNGKIRVKETDWQANRTVIAKDGKGFLIAMTTEGGFFTLYNFGRFLKESSLGINTAMNLDGGYEAQMRIKTPGFDYVTYGQFETYGPHKDVSIPNARCRIPTVICAYPRVS